MTSSGDATRKSQWLTLIRRSLKARLDKSQFQRLAAQLRERSTDTSADVARDVLSCAYPAATNIDVFLRTYIDCLVDMGIITSGDLLSHLVGRSRRRLRSATTKKEGDSEPGDGERMIRNAAVDENNETDTNASEASKAQLNHVDGDHGVIIEIAMLDLLTRAYVARRRPQSPLEAQQVLIALAQYMDILVRSSSSTQDAMATALDTHAPLLCDALGLFVLAVLENPRIQDVVGRRLPKKAHRGLSRAMASFLAYWSQASPKYAGPIQRLQQAQHNLGLIEETPSASAGDKTAAAELTATLQLQGVIDLPLLHARGSMLVVVSKLTSGRAYIADQDLSTLLNAWYKSDLQSQATGLILAAFDCLASAMRQGDTVDAMFPLRSVLINKVPVLLTSIFRSAFTAMDPQMCIAQALSQVDTNLFPPPSLGMMTDSILPDIRQDFLFSCVLHGLLPAANVTTLLGEEPMMPPPSPATRPTKEDLSQQCASSPEKAGQFIKQMISLDGNGAAYAATITDLLISACAGKDTIFLKTLCVSLCTNQQTLDVMFSFSDMSTILHPLCLLLDTWQFEEDQGEYQPVYEEFAIIFLFVLAVIYRFDLSPQALGLPKYSFVDHFTSSGSYAFRVEEMSDEQSSHLASWIKGLFDTDGITDEVTSSCRPQQFYLLLPTILDQAVFATAEGVLNHEAIKSGLEYLLEPFLLPSLVAAANWISDVASQKTSQDLAVILLIIQRLMKAPTSSTDATAMHSAILSIIALPLSGALETIKQRNPKIGAGLDQMLSVLTPRISYRRNHQKHDAEFQTWLGMPGGIQEAFRHSFNALGQWSATIAMSPTQQFPRQYHSRLSTLCCLLAGSQTTLKIIVQELTRQSAAADGTAPLYFDVAVAVIVADELLRSGAMLNDGSRQRPIQTPSGGQNINTQPQLPSMYQLITSGVTSMGAKLSLYGALRVAFEDAPVSFKDNIAEAQTIVRLHRRVLDVFNTAAAAASGTVPVDPGMNVTTQAILDSASLDAAAMTMIPDLTADAVGRSLSLAVDSIDMTASTDTGVLDLDLSGDPMQGLLGNGQQGLMNGNGDLTTQTTDLTGDDGDVFAGLELDGDIDFGF